MVDLFSRFSIDSLLSLVLALIMFGIGSSLTHKDYNNLIQHPKALVLGLVLQMLFLPVIALLLLPLTPLAVVFQAGLFVLMLCPGGTTSNFISYLVKGDVALSISLTSMNSFIILVSIPVFTQVGLPFFGEGTGSVSIGFADTAKDVFLVIILPAIAGLVFNHRYASFSAALQNPLKYINITLLALVFGIKFFADEQSGGSGLTTDEILLIFPYALGIHILALVFSYFIARRFTLSIPQAITIGIEVGLQNTTLALLVTGSMIGNNDMTKPVLVYAMFSFFTTALFAFSVRYMNRSYN